MPGEARKLREMITFRCSKEEKAVIEAAAAQQGSPSVGGYVKALVLANARSTR